MQERHKNKRRYFEEQGLTTEKYVVPLLLNFTNITPETKVLEIGCGEAGNLKPFLDLGCKATGIDISCARIELAKEYFINYKNRQNLSLICEDIYNAEYLDTFDIILMRDVIEHIPNQEKFMGYVKKFLKPDGKFFLGFPPWYNPFGGHQQICQNKFLSKIPYFHIFPRGIYKFILKAFNESSESIASLLEIKDTGISVERFETILKKEKYAVDKRIFYFINPNYEIKFGLKPRRQIQIINSIPGLRNFLTTAMYYVISK